MELGTYLKEQRLEQGVSLDQLQTITKIQKRYLQAIEEGNYEILPGKFYARAFLKQYTEAIGLDPDQIFTEFEHEIPKATEQEVPERLSRGRKQNASVKMKNPAIVSLLPTLLVFLLIIGIAVSVWIFMQNGSSNNGAGSKPNKPVDSVESELGNTPIKKDTTNPADQKGTATDTSKPDPAGAEPPPKKQAPQQSLRQLSQTTTGTPQTTYELTGTDTFKVTFAAKANNRSYLGIKNVKGKSFFAQEIANSEVKAFDLSAETEIEFNIGNTSGVTFKLNDQVVPFELTQAHQKVTIKFKKVKK